MIKFLFNLHHILINFLFLIHNLRLLLSWLQTKHTQSFFLKIPLTNIMLQSLLIAMYRFVSDVCHIETYSVLFVRDHQYNSGIVPLVFHSTRHSCLLQFLYFSFNFSCCCAVFCSFYCLVLLLLFIFISQLTWFLVTMVGTVIKIS